MIQLSDGFDFDFTKPHAPTIRTIAASLAKLCRFVGHTRGFYSVAQHSVYVSYLVPREYAVAALLHDASESVTGDCSSPLKRMLPEFQRIEAEVQHRINNWYCPIAGTPECQATVHAADLKMLATERRDLMPMGDPSGVWDWVEREVSRAAFTVVPWDWQMAENRFLARYIELGGEL